MAIVREKICLSPDFGVSLIHWNHAAHSEGIPTLVLIHGSGDCGPVWKSVIHALIDRFCIVTLDLRGHGDSDWAQDGNYAVAAMVQDLKTVAVSRNWQDFVLVGHSLGGEVALKFAAQNPRLVKQLILVDSAPEMNPNSVAHIRQVIVTAHRTYQSVEEYWKVLQERHPLAAQDLLKDIAEAATREGRGGTTLLKYDPGFARALEKGENDSEWAYLARIVCPTLLLRGVASSVVSQKTAERMARSLPNGKLIVIPAAGHSLQIDNPQACAQAIIQFLQS